MEYITVVNQVVDYIEKNLKEDISLSSVAKNVSFSQFHLSRIFVGITGCTICDYIRKRRLTKAAKEIIETDKKILDISLEYGFNSPEVFTRAFTKQFSLSPKEFRKRNKLPHLYEVRKMNRFDLDHRYYGMTIEPRVEEKMLGDVIGISFKIRSVNVPENFRRFRERRDEIEFTLDREQNLGIIRPDVNSSEYDPLNYMTGVLVSKVGNIPDGMVHYRIPEGNYAKFVHKNSINLILDTYRYIYGIWLPKSGYRLVEDAPNIEVYDGRYYRGNPDVAIYIPIEDA